VAGHSQRVLGIPQVRGGRFANYIGEVDYFNALNGDPLTVDSYLTFDVQASYKLPWDVKVTVGVNNIADSAPPRYLGGSSEAMPI